MKITVTRDHIKAGKPRNITACPIALAVMDDKKKSCCLVYEFLEVKGPNGWRIYRLPKKARDFIMAFDTDKTVTPFSFEARKVS